MVFLGRVLLRHFGHRPLLLRQRDSSLRVQRLLRLGRLGGRLSLSCTHGVLERYVRSASTDPPLEVPMGTRKLGQEGALATAPWKMHTYFCVFFGF